MNKTLYIVYSRFIDDPSIVLGIFDNKLAAMNALVGWDDRYKEIAEIELNTINDPPITLE